MGNPKMVGKSTVLDEIVNTAELDFCTLHCIITAGNELRKVLFSVPSVCGFLVVYEISWGTAERNCSKSTWKTCLVPRLDEFKDEKVKDQGYQGQKRHFSALSAACVQFVW